MTYHIKRLRIRNYRGVEALDIDVPPAGLTVSGCNGAGKTSVVKAIRAALAAQDIGEDAIRLGADRAEILVDLDDATVRRLITRSGSSLTIDRGEGKLRSPQKWLTDLLGTAPLDPIDLFTAQPKQRRAQILAALPVRMLRDELVAALPAWSVELLALDEIDFSAHGLDVLAVVRKVFAARRKDIAAAVKLADTRVTERRADFEAFKDAAPAGPVKDTVDAVATLTRARADLDARAARVADGERRQASTRTRIAELRSKADDAERHTAIDLAALEIDTTIHRSACDRVTELKAALATAEEARVVALTALDRRKAENERARAALRDVAACRAQADDLAKTIAELSETPPTADEIVAADAALLEARKSEEAAAKWFARTTRSEMLADAERMLREHHEQEGKLNGVIDIVSRDLPNKLLAAAKGIPGVSLDGDDVLLDGVSIMGLSGREQLLFAVEVARRANQVSKLLIIDGLERLDPDALPEFLRAATAGDFQLIATRVDRGDVVFDSISAATTDPT